jgi:hypothetical protein
MTRTDHPRQSILVFLFNDAVNRKQLVTHRNMLVEWGDRIDDADYSPVGKSPDLAAYPMPEDLTEGH